MEPLLFQRSFRQKHTLEESGKFLVFKRKKTAHDQPAAGNLCHRGLSGIRCKRCFARHGPFIQLHTIFILRCFVDIAGKFIQIIHCIVMNNKMSLGFFRGFHTFPFLCRRTICLQFKSIHLVRTAFPGTLTVCVETPFVQRQTAVINDIGIRRQLFPFAQFPVFFDVGNNKISAIVAAEEVNPVIMKICLAATACIRKFPDFFQIFDFSVCINNPGKNGIGTLPSFIVDRSFAAKQPETITKCNNGSIFRIIIFEFCIGKDGKFPFVGTVCDGACRISGGTCLQEIPVDIAVHLV